MVAVYKKIIEDKMQSKHHMEFEEDFFSLTMLCYLKVNRNKFLLSHSKQSLNLQNAIIVSCAQLLMLLCMTMALIEDEEGDYKMTYNGN